VDDIISCSWRSRGGRLPSVSPPYSSRLRKTRHLLDSLHFGAAVSGRLWLSDFAPSGWCVDIFWRDAPGRNPGVRQRIHACCT
jgi:hypothetical protein